MNEQPEHTEVHNVSDPSEKLNHDTTMCVLSHILGLLTGFIGPLIIMLTSQNPRDKAHAQVALNWQISMMIYALASALLIFVLLGCILLPLIMAIDITFCIIAAVKAKDGILWEYPLSIPFLKG